MRRRPATPSAMVWVGPVVTMRRWRHECHRRCAQRLDADHLDVGCLDLQRMTHTGGLRPPPRAIRTASNDAAVCCQFQADDCRALAGLDVQAVFD
jgi:hypothetical protein